MCTYMHTYMHVYTQYVYICIYIYIYIIYTHIHAHIYTHDMYLYIHSYVHVHMQTYVCVCLYWCICTYTYIICVYAHSATWRVCQCMPDVWIPTLHPAAPESKQRKAWTGERCGPLAAQLAGAVVFHPWCCAGAIWGYAKNPGLYPLQYLQRSSR